MGMSWDWHKNLDIQTTVGRRVLIFIVTIVLRYLHEGDWHQGPLLLTWFNFNPSMDK